MIVIVGVTLAVLLSGWWLWSYYRERDAEDATSSVASGVFAIGVGLFAAVIVILENGAVALSMVGDQLAAHAPWLSQIAVTAVGWFAFDNEILLDPMTWLAASAGVALLAIMMGRQ